MQRSPSQVVTDRGEGKPLPQESCLGVARSPFGKVLVGFMSALETVFWVSDEEKLYKFRSTQNPIQDHLSSCSPDIDSLPQKSRHFGWDPTGYG